MRNIGMVRDQSFVVENSNMLALLEEVCEQVKWGRVEIIIKNGRIDCIHITNTIKPEK